MPKQKTFEEIEEYKSQLKAEIHKWQNIMHKMRRHKPRSENWGEDEQIQEIQNLIQEIHEAIENECFKYGEQLKKIRRYDDKP